MGADFYWYYVPYEEDKNNALQKLRKREFEAGRYRPVFYTWNLEFPIDDISKAPTPGKQHNTIEDAIKNTIPEGTGSILDLEKISEEMRHGRVYVLKSEEIIKYFNTEKPTRNIIEENMDKVWEDIWRGQGVCITVYKDDTPTELLFMGVSWD